MQTINRIYDNLKGDKIIWFIVTLLALCSVLAVYSAVGHEAHFKRGGDTEYYLFKQCVLLSIGFGLMYLAYKFNYMFYSKVAPLLLFVAVPMLVFTLGFTDGINDARRWITIPFINQSFQTSDLAKLALIIFIARSIAKKQDVIKDFKTAFVPLIIPVVLVCILIAPADLSTAALLFATCLLMMIIGRISLKYLILLVVIGVAALSFLVLLGSFFDDVIRLDTWISRVQEFTTDGGWQIKQSKIAIANGELIGVGPGNSMQRNYLPYAYADFIYAIICEEYGLFGAVVIISLYIGILYRCTKMVTKCPKTFGSILAMGLCINIVLQAMTNMAVSVHLLPVTGLTLPLISMGGTSILFTCISLGVILSVSRYVEEYSFEEIVEEEDSVAEDYKLNPVKERRRMNYENYY